MYKNIFQKAGLTPTQALILDYLYEKKEGKAGEIAKKIKKSRAIVYKDLEELAVSKLIEKTDKPGQVSVFRVGHPSYMEKFFDQKEDKIKKDRQLFKSYLPDMVSAYNLMSDKPGIRYYVGVDGMKNIYDEILRDGKDFYLIRSAYEPVYKKEILPIVEQFIKKRVAKNIKVTAITPTDIIKSNSDKDVDWLMERFWVDKDMYNSPVEIDIYGNKVAILSFGEELMGMIIESKQIAQSLKQIFILATFGTQIKRPAENNPADQKNNAQLS